MKNPCYGCNDRNEVCHIEGNCQKYGEYRAELLAQKEKIFKERMKDYPARRREYEVKRKAWRDKHR